MCPNFKKKRIKKKGKDDKKKKSKRKEKEQTDGGERENREIKEKKKIFSLLSKIYGNRTVGFHQRKRQSRSTHRELRVSAKIFEFRQTPRGKEFSYLGYF